jgi:hydrogenase maturation protease
VPVEPNQPNKRYSTNSQASSAVLVLGLGNELLSDQAVGLIALRRLREEGECPPWLHFAECQEVALSLLDLVVGYQGLVVVDSIQTGRVGPGFIHEFRVDDSMSFGVFSPHFVGIGEMLALGKELGMNLPTEVRIIAIEVLDPCTMSGQLTEKVQAGIDTAVRKMMQSASEVLATVRTQSVQ